MKRVISSLDLFIEWSLYILVFSVPFSKTLIELCAISAIACWVFKKIILGRKYLRVVRTDINIPMAVFLLISFLSIFWSTHPGISIRAFVSKLMEYAALYFVVAEALRERRVARNLIRALAAAAAVACLDGFYQLFTGYDFVRLQKSASFGRISGPFDFPNAFGAWLLLASFPFISMALFYNRYPVLRVWNALFSALLAYTLFLAYTRAAFISFIAALFVMFIVRGGKVFYIATAVLAAAIAALFLAIPKNMKYITGFTKLFSAPSSVHRLDMWKTAFRMFLDRPFLGQGLNTFMANYEKFRAAADAKGVWYAHNCYLQIAAETGIFGLMAFLWIVLKTVIISIRTWKDINDDFLRYVYLGLFCGITAFLIASAVETTLYSLKLVVMFYLSLGILFGIKNLGCKAAGA